MRLSTAVKVAIWILGTGALTAYNVINEMGPVFSMISGAVLGYSMTMVLLTWRLDVGAS